VSFRARSYPHPVLSPFARDYVDQSEIVGSFTRQSEQGSLTVGYEIKQTSQRLDEFLADKQAALGLSLYAKGSRWKTLQLIDSTQGKIVIPEASLYGTLEVTPVIVATTDVALDFAGINPEYGTSRFAVQEGDLLAYGPTEALEIDHQKSSVDEENWIKLSLSPALDPNEYEIDVNNNEIIVFAGENVMLVTKAISAATTMQPYLFMSIYKDAFVAAIEYIFASFAANEEPEYDWAKGLQAYLDARDASLDEIAQGDPNSISRFVLRMIASDGIGALAKRVQAGQALQ